MPLIHSVLPSPGVSPYSVPLIFICIGFALAIIFFLYFLYIVLCKLLKYCTARDEERIYNETNVYKDITLPLPAAQHRICNMVRELYRCVGLEVDRELQPPVSLLATQIYPATNPTIFDWSVNHYSSSDQPYLTPPALPARPMPIYFLSSNIPTSPCVYTVTNDDATSPTTDESIMQELVSAGHIKEEQTEKVLIINPEDSVVIAPADMIIIKREKTLPVTAEQTEGQSFDSYSDDESVPAMEKNEQSVSAAIPPPSFSPAPYTTLTRPYGWWNTSFDSVESELWVMKELEAFERLEKKREEEEAAAREKEKEQKARDVIAKLAYDEDDEGLILKDRKDNTSGAPVSASFDRSGVNGKERYWSKRLAAQIAKEKENYFGVPRSNTIAF